ncbi:DUF3466 family protein [Photobacterium indicum]|uniref:GlyGly-CTERM sorting domain-containing protein n=1 Tax=Photobacterium indicum TaxID=81447 RepID=A0A2T3L2R1_9GAMM|nr:DUF3466 family protein [Photobacterium indicum]PSV43162.1 GlyGly-CTERM sorting domain-containing protein [Photobacterium indicum]
MQHKMLKLSTLAILIAGATGANAAVYKVVQVTDTSGAESLQYFPTANTSSNSVEFYGQGIEATSTSQNCFTTDCGDADEYKVVGESRRGTDGINYRDTIAFLTDNYQHINDRNEFERYCNDNLGFNTCNVWSEAQYYGNAYNREQADDRTGLGGLQREQAAWSLGYYSNASAIVYGETLSTFANSADGYSDADKAVLGTIIDSGSHVTPNSVVNGIVAEAGTDYVYGITSSAYFSKDGRNARAFDKRGFVNAGANKTELTPPAASIDRPDDKLAEQMGQTLANDAVIYDSGSGSKLLVVGSASYAPSFYYNRGTTDSKNWYYDSDKVPNTDDINVSGLGFSGTDFQTCAATPTAANVYSKYECQFSTFANQAAFWLVDSATTGKVTASAIVKPSLPVLDVDSENRSYQASAQAISLVNNLPIAVGFATDSVDNDYYAPRAAIFESKAAGSSLTWTEKFIPGIDIERGSDRIYSYTVATDINANNVVVGVGKNFRAANRSYAEAIFIYDNQNDSLKMLDSNVNANIFFDGSNGRPSAINGNNQVVGWVDSETVNQIDGRERRQRAFTYIAGDTAIAGSPLTAGGSWMINDLTYGDESNSIVANNNQYRIAQATDINDAGVISATAFMCDGGYDSFSNEAQCKGGGVGKERVVAVKLVPIPDGTVDVRPEESGTIKRSGASFGMFALTLLGLFGFRRRK